MKTIGLVVLLFAAAAFGQDSRPRVFITDSQSWETGGSGGGTDGSWGASGGGGARPQTAEIVKTFGQRCPAVVTNNIREKSDYIVLLDHEGGKVWFEHDNKVAVFERVSGDTVISKSTLSLGGSVQTACEAITHHWSENSGRIIRARTGSGDGQPGATLVAAKAPTLAVSSNPDGADIEVDGKFMGNTPSSLELGAGDHDVTISKTGYKAWHRKLTLAGGDVRVNAELEKN